MQTLLIHAIDIFFRLLYILIFIRILCSWLPGISRTTIGHLLYQVTEPIPGPVRRMVDRSPIGGGMMLDFSPVVALFLMEIVEVVLKSIVATLL